MPERNGSAEWRGDLKGGSGSPVRAFAIVND